MTNAKIAINKRRCFAGNTCNTFHFSGWLKVRFSACSTVSVAIVSVLISSSTADIVSSEDTVWITGSCSVLNVSLEIKGALS